ncbi:hypothetical protein LTR37_010842 [Vermiconidia calcicola]|uniref:Uncharacterized protein n=1 Tax=Vermiconidia calcicola TaxID=1690605 RepID=A0ACC3N6J8_9PEZI|nr:hypothetical protein LTR37_010842 [Vermiconidia calcicola]
MPASISPPWRWRRRRVFMVILGILFLYVFVHNIPTDLGSIDERMGKPLRPGHIIHGAQELREPAGAPPRSSEDSEGEGQYYYNGPIKFYRLATTLRGISGTMGSKLTNRNVLFAASSLKSVANLMPMACEMAKRDRNYVHLAILGRDPLPIEDILEVNGVDEESCVVYFHDARGDFTEFSSDMRAEVAVAGAMKHINDFIHPQAIITDDSSLEDDFFVRAMRKKTKDYRRTLIEIPAGRYEDFLWMTRLSSGSLANWFSPSIDILVHAPPESSGGLIRLIKSLERADYTGLKAPSLTIELPTDIEYFARRYLEDLEWPPDETASPLKSNALSLRHRIQSSRINSEQASLRFLESFYPTSSYHHHVLILSPRVEVGALFLQYLYFTVLEYRYSGAREADELLGVSLDVPTTFPDGKTELVPPKVANMNSHRPKRFDNMEQHQQSPFLYQAPSSTAILVFGDSWATFHNFLTNRMKANEAGKAEKHNKQYSETEPAWMEYLLELMATRAWNVLHPASSFVTVHNELARIPEEYMRDAESDQAETKLAKQVDPAEDEPFLRAPEPPVFQPRAEKATDDGTTALQDVLPFDGELPELPHLPHLWPTGEFFTRNTMVNFQNRYLSYFRRKVGGCDDKNADRKRVIRYMTTDDLFCLPGIEPEFEEERDEDEDEDEKEDEKEEAELAELITKATQSLTRNSGSIESGDVAGAAAVGESNNLEQATAETREGIQSRQGSVGG